MIVSLSPWQCENFNYLILILITYTKPKMEHHDEKVKNFKKLQNIGPFYKAWIGSSTNSSDGTVYIACH